MFFRIYLDFSCPTASPCFSNVGGSGRFGEIYTTISKYVVLGNADTVIVSRDVDTVLLGGGVVLGVKLKVVVLGDVAMVIGWSPKLLNYDSKLENKEEVL